MFTPPIFADIFGIAWILLIVPWILLALIPAIIAKNKGYSFIGWFLLSIFFWWITLFVTLFMPNRNPQ